MDDLTEKLERLLSSPEGMAKIQSAMSALTGAVGTQPEPTPPPPPADNGGADLSALTKLIPLLSGLGQDNEDTRLLQALRPYLHGQRAERLEDTVRLLRMARLVPLLQEQGILPGIGGGGYGG